VKTFVRQQGETFNILMWIAISPGQWCVIDDDGKATIQGSNGDYSELEWEPSDACFDIFGEHE